MTYKRLIYGIALGSAIAGIGYVLLHPSAKKIRSRLFDMTLDGIDHLIDVLRKSETEIEDQDNPPAASTAQPEAITNS